MPPKLTVSITLDAEEDERKDDEDEELDIWLERDEAGTEEAMEEVLEEALKDVVLLPPPLQADKNQKMHASNMPDMHFCLRESATDHRMSYPQICCSKSLA